MSILKPTYCLDCNKEVEGRSDKIFCDKQCRSSYHYKNNRAKKISLFKQIDLQLKLNRKLLKHFNQAGKAEIRKEKLTSVGFNPKYFTHYWKNQKGNVYLFCYEYGYLAIKKENIDKYLLVHWQDYMGGNN